MASNVRSLGGRALNTAEIARQCKRLMVAYNIGQRLFAKYVMNQVVKVKCCFLLDDFLGPLCML